MGIPQTLEVRYNLRGHGPQRPSIEDQPLGVGPRDAKRGTSTDLEAPFYETKCGAAGEYYDLSSVTLR